MRPEWGTPAFTDAKASYAAVAAAVRPCRSALRGVRASPAIRSGVEGSRTRLPITAHSRFGSRSSANLGFSFKFADMSQLTTNTAAAKASV